MKKYSKMENNKTLMNRIDFNFNNNNVDINFKIIVEKSKYIYFPLIV